MTNPAEQIIKSFLAFLDSRFSFQSTDDETETLIHTPFTGRHGDGITVLMKRQGTHDLMFSDRGIALETQHPIDTWDLYHTRAIVSRFRCQLCEGQIVLHCSTADAAKGLNSIIHAIIFTEARGQGGWTGDLLSQFPIGLS